VKTVVALVVLVLALIVIGCKESTDSIASQGSQTPPERMPNTVGITAGQSGTGATSGGSTGY